MPLYEYQCAKDGTFELVQKFSDPPLTACPKCGGPVEKLLSAPAIQFKGSGWYITDYARKSSGGEAAKDKAAAAAESKGSSESKGPSDSKSSSESKSSSDTKSGTSSTPSPSSSGSSTEKK